jgi:hypothetical protein
VQEWEGSMKIIAHWLGVLTDIEADTKAVLNILVSCR